jgi:hypothetical protein
MLSLILEVIQVTKLVLALTKEIKTGPDVVWRSTETVANVKVLLETVIREDLMKSAIYRGLADQLYVFTVFPVIVDVETTTVPVTVKRFSSC